MLNELLDLEQQGWKSLCNSTGADFYGRIMSSVYTRQDGTWRLALYQQTPVPTQP